MKKVERRTERLLLLLLLPFMLAGVSVAAQMGATYDLTWHSLDGGGGVSTGGAYWLGGTVGQADGSASAALSGGAYELTGGFWLGAGQGPTIIDWQGARARAGGGPAPVFWLILFGLLVVGPIWIWRCQVWRRQVWRRQVWRRQGEKSGAR